MKTKILILLLFTVTLGYAQHNPFKLFEQSLDQMTQLGPGRFTVFIGLGFNFANPRFSMYLQDDYMWMSEDDSGFKYEKDKITMRFIPKVSDGSEYIEVKYYVEDKTGIPQQYPTEGGITKVITKVELIGSTDLMVKLFINYWPYTLKLGGFKAGDIAHYQALGDYVALIGITPNTYKILITSENLKSDYYSAYKIE